MKEGLTQKRETSIERKVRERTPSFFCSTNYFIQKYHSYILWNCPVRFKEKTVRKKILEKGKSVDHDYNVAMPDFVLMNKKQMQILNKTIKKAQKGKRYKNPFLRKNGWFCQVFGDYWHSQEIIGISKEQHEKQVREAYESNGNHILILWQKDIENHWQEYCQPKINKFIQQFKKQNEVSEDEIIESKEILSDLSLKCLNDCLQYRKLSEEEKKYVVQDIVNVYQGLDVYEDVFDAEQELKDYKKYIEKGLFSRNNTGNIILNCFIKSRFDARVKKNRSINQIYKDRELMKKVIDYQFSHESGVHHQKRILAAMMFSCGFRVVNNLNQNLVALRLQKFAKKDGVFFDPCAGWGGRLLAAYALGMKYIAIDANKKLVDELKQLAKFIGFQNCEIFYGDSSDLKFVEQVLNGRKIDLSFTCPPYFDEQIYSEDEEQSIKKYPDKDNWYKYFLNYMVEAVLRNLDENGNFILCVDETIDMKKINNAWIKEFECTKGAKEDHYYFIKKQGEELKLQVDFVRCLECGKSFRRLGYHLLKEHNMTNKEYLQKYKDASLICDKQREIVVKNNINKFDGVPTTYKKRFVYLLPDGKYASKSDLYKREWGVETINPQHIIKAQKVEYLPRYKQIESGEEGKDYVCCSICGYKAKSLTQHIRKDHNLTKKEYIQKYQSEVYSKTAKEAFHQCALNKWKTQFETGQSKRAVHKERAENPITKQRNDITYEILEKLQNEGKTQVEMQKILGCSEPTLYKWMQVVGYKPMSKTLNAIKRAVFEGAELNLEEITQDKLDELYPKFNKDELMKKCGVKRTVFETWLKNNNLMLRKVKKENKVLLSSDYEYEPGLQRNEDISDDEISEELLNKIKEKGFPYYKQEEFDVKTEIEKVRNESNIIIDNHVKNSSGTSGGGFLLSFFPNFFEVDRDCTHSALYSFNYRLRHVVRDVIRHYDKLTVGTLRTELKSQQRITGFRATLAKQIYDRYCPENGEVLDPCGGWGGRMFGAYCSDKVKSYECLDASADTVKGLNRLKCLLDRNIEKEVKVSFGCYENFESDKKYDMIFTSPPYFSKQHYSEDKEQSYIKYKTYEEWKEGFLRNLIDKSFQFLKEDGLFIVNIDDVKIKEKEYALKEDFLKMTENKFEVKEILYMDYKNRYSGAFHGEPIYIMRKVKKTLK